MLMSFIDTLCSHFAYSHNSHVCQKMNNRVNLYVHTHGLLIIQPKYNNDFLNYSCKETAVFKSIFSTAFNKQKIDATIMDLLVIL